MRTGRTPLAEHPSAARHAAVRGMVVVVAALAGGACDRGAAGSADPGPAPAPPAEPPGPGAERPDPPPPRISREAFAEAMLAEARGKDYRSHPALLARVRRSPHAFFRAVNRSFSNSVCTAFAEWVEDAPEVNLHGDAHLEQYAVTDEGRGLTDFDDATSGPPVLDVVRLATSISLAAAERGWDPDPLLDALSAGYADGLTAPDDRPDPPAYVTRIREAHRKPRRDALAEAEGLMGEVTANELASLRAGITSYGAERREMDPALPASYFEVKRAGTLRLGIGSALDRKYLFRVEGPTAAEEDDLLLEAKEVRALDGISCIHTAQGKSPLRILIASTRLSYHPYAHVGYYLGNGRNFWIHAWQTNYRELSVSAGGDASLVSAAELQGVVRDAGFQLGRGHPNQVGVPLEGEVRHYLRRRVGRQTQLARARLHLLVAAVGDAFERFVAETEDTGAPPGP